MKDKKNYLSLDDLFFDDGVVNEKTDKRITLDSYINKFGHGLPLELIPDTIPEEEILQKVQICIDNNQDNLLELLGIETNETDLY